MGMYVLKNVCHKKADKGSHTVWWDYKDYIAEPKKQLSKNNDYREANVKWN